MAITKKNIEATPTNTELLELIKQEMEIVWPNTKITLENEDGLYILKVDGAPLLRVATGSYNLIIGMALYSTGNVTYYDPSDSALGYVYAFYTTAKGFCIKARSSRTVEDFISYAFCKDNNGNIVAVANGAYSAGTISWASNGKSIRNNSFSAYGTLSSDRACVTSNKTALCPIILNDHDESYCDDICWCVGGQTNDPLAIVDIDGVKWITNGRIALKDE